MELLGRAYRADASHPGVLALLAHHLLLQVGAAAAVFKCF
jgi:hypothetical protein